jgi:hypothetical protein
MDLRDEAKFPIPEAAHSRGYQPERPLLGWTMVHSSEHRFELRFGLPTPMPWQRKLASCFWWTLVFAYLCLVIKFMWTVRDVNEAKNFGILSAFGWLILWSLHPKRGMRVQELVIDRRCGKISITGLVDRRQVTVHHPLTTVRKVDYIVGSNSSVSRRPARIIIHFRDPQHEIELDRLDAYETSLPAWIHSMIGVGTPLENRMH